MILRDQGEGYQYQLVNRAGWGGNLPKGFRNLKPSIREKPE